MSEKERIMQENHIEKNELIYHLDYLGKNIIFFNQRSSKWTYPYEHITAPEENLHTSGCGVFALSHGVQWMSGKKIDPIFLADFSKEHGGRGDDGTDRPQLLSSLMEERVNEKYLFSYNEDGLLNDLDLLWSHIYSNKGIALCNLRKGHIVALVAGNIIKGEKRYLVIDSYLESNHEQVKEYLREVVPSSAVTVPIYNSHQILTGYETCFGMFWVNALLPKDFNLIHQYIGG